MLGVWQFPTLTLAPGGQSIKRSPLQPNALNKRLQGYLHALRQWHGETTHSLRRGATQFARRNGKIVEDIAHDWVWSSTKTLRLYPHPTRHAKRFKVSNST